jgi:hypothetical protein
VTARALALGAGLAAIALVAAATAGRPELIAFPAGYQNDFVLYSKVDRIDTKRIRFMYVNRAAHDAARAGEPVPRGAILIMEDRKPRLDGEQLVFDADGRLIATDEILAVAVMQKEAGWGADYPASKRNGEWEYAAFRPDGSRNADVRSFDGCFTCHLSRAEDGRDYTFTFAKYVIDGKPKL